MTGTTQATDGQRLKAIDIGKFITLRSRLERGGSLQARKLGSGAIVFYWRFSLDGGTHREPIGTYDPAAPPKKLDPTAQGGYTIAAALRRCDELGKTHSERATTGGYLQVKAEQREAFAARKVAAVEKSERTLGKLLDAYVEHLKRQERRSAYDAENLFANHIKGAHLRLWSKPAADITIDDAVDLQRRLIEAKKGRTANKLRAYARSAYQLAIDVRSTASIPAAFRAFGVTSNPFALTKRDASFDRADKRPLSVDELREYLKIIRAVPDTPGFALRLHLLTGGQRIEQLLRLRWVDVRESTITLFDSKGRPGAAPRPHTLPLLPPIADELEKRTRTGDFVLSTSSDGKTSINSTTLSGWAVDIVGDAIAGFQLKRVRSGVETLLASCGISREVRGHVQSHGLTGVQARHYDAHDYMPEKRRALETLLAELERKPSRKVVPIKRKRA